MQTNGYTYIVNPHITFFPKGETLVLIEFFSPVPQFLLLSTHMELIGHHPLELFDLLEIEFQPWGLFPKHITLFSFHWNHMCKSL